MKEKIISSILCILVSTLVLAGDPWKAEYIDMAPVGFSIESVEDSPKATIINFRYQGNSKNNVGIRKECYIVDAEGIHHPAINAKGIKLGNTIKLNKQGVAHFSIYFSPLPASTEAFDFIEGTGGWNMVQMMMIHKAGTRPALPALNLTHVNGITENDFREDTVWVSGSLKNTKLNRDNTSYYSSIPFPADIYSKWTIDNICGNHIHMNADNTFELKWIVDRPTIQYLHFNYALIPVLLIPGDHVTVDISHPGESNQQVTYGGRCAAYSRLLSNMPAIMYNYGARLTNWDDPYFPMKKISKIASDYEVFRNYFTAKYQLSPEEARLLQAETDLYPATLCIRHWNKIISDSQGNRSKKVDKETTFDLRLLKKLSLDNIETYCAPMSVPFSSQLYEFLETLQIDLPSCLNSGNNDIQVDNFKSDSTKYAWMEQ